MKWNDLTFWKKSTIGFGIPLLLICLFTGWVVWEMNSISAEVGSFQADVDQAQTTLQQSISKFDQLRKTESHTSLQQIQTELKEVINTNFGETGAVIQNHVQNARRRALVFCGVAIILILITTTIFSKRISGSLKKSIRFAEQLAEGDLSVTTAINQKDEIGILTAAINSTRIKIREIILGIREAVDQVAASADQLATSSQSLAQSATEQASNIDEISTTIEQLANSIEHNAGRAQQTSEMTVKASLESERRGINRFGHCKVHERYRPKNLYHRRYRGSDKSPRSKRRY